MRVDRGSSARLPPSLIERVLATCERADAGDLDGLIALLRRFQREAAWETARRETARLAAEETPPSSENSSGSPLIDLAAFEAELLAAA